MARTLSEQKLISGNKAPHFNLQGIDGKNYSLNDFNSKSILVIFICNHCPFVKARIGDIIDLQSTFPPNELQIIAINSNDPSYQDEGFENMKNFAKRYNLNFPYLIDETQEVAKAYGAVCTPDPFLLDSNKTLIFHGKINDAVNPESKPSIHIMQENVRKLLKGKKLEKDFDPSIGCSIKWKD
ncbi:MAG: thioredoxin family protein [Nitrososphaeraceae archaeon]